MNHRMEELQNLVTLILGNIRLENVSGEYHEALQRLGAYESNIAGKSCWIIDFTDEHELAEILRQLQELGFLFVGIEPAGWSPADIFENLRGKHLVSGHVKEIRWRGPGDWFITER